MHVRQGGVQVARAGKQCGEVAVAFSKANMIKIQVTLFHAEGACTLFEGRPEECPPLPRPGDRILLAEHSVQVEGVQHSYREPGFVEVQLLA